MLSTYFWDPSTNSTTIHSSIYKNKKLVHLKSGHHKSHYKGEDSSWNNLRTARPSILVSVTFVTGIVKLFICEWNSVSPGAVTVFLLTSSQILAFLVIISTDRDIVLQVSWGWRTSSHVGFVVHYGHFTQAVAGTKFHFTSWTARSTTSTKAFIFTLEIVMYIQGNCIRKLL